MALLFLFIFVGCGMLAARLLRADTAVPMRERLLPMRVFYVQTLLPLYIFVATVSSASSAHLAMIAICIGALIASVLVALPLFNALVPMPDSRSPAARAALMLRLLCRRDMLYYGLPVGALLFAERHIAILIGVLVFCVLLQWVCDTADEREGQAQRHSGQSRYFYLPVCVAFALAWAVVALGERFPDMRSDEWKQFLAALRPLVDGVILLGLALFGMHLDRWSVKQLWQRILPIQLAAVGVVTVLCAMAGYDWQWFQFDNAEFLLLIFLLLSPASWEAAADDRLRDAVRASQLFALLLPPVAMVYLLSHYASAA